MSIWMLILGLSGCSTLGLQLAPRAAHARRHSSSWTTRRATAEATAEDTVADSLDDLFDGDIVTYRLEEELPEGTQGDGEGLGVVLENGSVQPLCMWSRTSNEFLWDEEVDTVPISRVVRRLDMSGVYPEQRKASRDVDPHGEHSEDAFILEPPTLQLPEGVFVALQPEREANW